MLVINSSDKLDGYIQTIFEMIECGIKPAFIEVFYSTSQAPAIPVLVEVETDFDLSCLSYRVHIRSFKSAHYLIVSQNDITTLQQTPGIKSMTACIFTN